ncbi:MAG: ABC transporter six-transmembrane domain-containing protein [Campylobacter sp.]
MNEKQNTKDDSAIIARVALSREFVNFFETHFPMFFTRVFRSLAQHLCSFCPAKGRCSVLYSDGFFLYFCQDMLRKMTTFIFA